jgi:multiple sugar transport system substrate-binding protein
MSERPLKTLRAASLAALLVAVCLATGCKKSQPVPIRLAGDAWFLNSLTKTGMIGSFERSTGIQVEVLDRDERTIMSDLDRGSEPGRPGYDVVVMRHRLLGALVKKNQVQPIDSMLADPSLQDAGFLPQQQLFPNWWRELSSYGNKIYGYPYTGLTAYLCYRKDMLNDPKNKREFKARYHRELAAPTTWKEYMQLAEFFNRPREHFYGTYISGKQGPALWYEWLNFVYSFGGNILDTQHGDEYGDIAINSPQNVAATEQYIKLIRFSPPDTLDFGWGQAQSTLQQGHAFMGLLWSDQVPFLEAPAVSKVAGKIGYSLIPSSSSQQASQLEGLTYLIPTESKEPREAYQFIEWAMSAQVQTQQTLMGGDSVRESTYEDPSVKGLPYTRTFLASVPVAKEKPTIPEAAQMTEATERRLSEIVTQKESPQSGLDKLALDYQQILGSKARMRYPVHGAS